jgi:hypothetical protein
VAPIAWNIEQPPSRRRSFGCLKSTTIPAAIAVTNQKTAGSKLSPFAKP